jgi:hypothetical protein
VLCTPTLLKVKPTKKAAAAIQSDNQLVVTDKGGILF